MREYDRWNQRLTRMTEADEWKNSIGMIDEIE